MWTHSAIRMKPSSDKVISSFSQAKKSPACDRRSLLLHNSGPCWMTGRGSMIYSLVVFRKALRGTTTVLWRRKKEIYFIWCELWSADNICHISLVIASG